MKVNKPTVIFSILASMILACGCATTSLPPTSEFQEDWTGLYLSVSRNIGEKSETYYLGSDEKWSYFETRGETLISPIYRKAETSTMSLSHTFPFGQGKPYRVHLSDFVGHNQRRGLP